jgi:hypothetical protein
MAAFWSSRVGKKKNALQASEHMQPENKPEGACFQASLRRMGMRWKDRANTLAGYDQYAGSILAIRWQHMTNMLAGYGLFASGKATQAASKAQFATGKILSETRSRRSPIGDRQEFE